ncbi:hypothetical protein L6164_020011 [Bauhinia variegata]|uniref:Uncharacterized protein n=1 Tax=Bauhinia variegata TaxID=167791 RepID=A0ACB9MTP6_BAUVA|nr:hypothetical protein L6164_020011 [Bauhinia variegata]
MSEVRAAPIFLFAVIFRVLLHFSSADPNIFLLGSVITSEANIFLTELELQSERSDCECSFGPLRSNIVIRTACCSVGVALPVYSTFKAIETKDQNAQQRCLLYWGSLIKVFSDKFLSWCPMYYRLKFAFLIWLQLPYTNGAKQLYVNHLPRSSRGIKLELIKWLVLRTVKWTMPVKITGSDRTQEHNPEIIQPDRSQQNSPGDEPATSSDSEPDRNHNT